MGKLLPIQPPVWGVVFVIAFSGVASAETFTIQGTITDTQPIYKTRTYTPKHKNVGQKMFLYMDNPAKIKNSSVPGAIIGGIIGNNVTKNLPDGGTAGAIHWWTIWK